MTRLKLALFFVVMAVVSLFRPRLGLQMIEHATLGAILRTVAGAAAEKRA